jgi:hypothetical protein
MQWRSPYYFEKIAKIPMAKIPMGAPWGQVCQDSMIEKRLQFDQMD